MTRRSLSHDSRNAEARDGGLSDRGFYEIRVQGCLDSSWSEWFDGMEVTADNQHGETILSGWVVDQAALHGVLNRIRDLGLVLLALKRATHAASVDTGIGGNGAGSGDGADMSCR